MNNGEGSSNRAARRNIEKLSKKINKKIYPKDKAILYVNEALAEFKEDAINEFVLAFSVQLINFGALLRRPSRKQSLTGEEFLAMPREKEAALNYLYWPALLNESRVRILSLEPQNKEKYLLTDQCFFLNSTVEDLALRHILDTHEAISNFVKKITYEHPVWKDLGNMGLDAITEQIEKYNIAQAETMADKYKSIHQQWLNLASTYKLSKQRFRGIRNKMATLDSLIKESGTTDSGDLNCSGQMANDRIFLTSFMSCQLKPVNTNLNAMELERTRPMNASIINYSVSDQEEDAGFVFKEEMIDPAVLSKAVEYFLELEEKYEIFYKERFKALTRLRKEKIEAQKAALEIAPPPKTLTTLYAEVQKNTSPRSTEGDDDTDVSVNKSPKRRDLADSADSQASSSSNAEIRTFAGMKLDPQSVGMIRKAGCKQYFYLDLVALADEEINVKDFLNIPVKFAAAQGDTGLKTIGKYQVKCRINGAVHTLDACYELKQKHNTDRILVVQIPCDQKDAHECLFVGLIGLPGGLHNGDVLKLDPNKIYELNAPECSRFNPELMKGANVNRLDNAPMPM